MLICEEKVDISKCNTFSWVYTVGIIKKDENTVFRGKSAILSDPTWDPFQSGVESISELVSIIELNLNDLNIPWDNKQIA